MARDEDSADRLKVIDDSLQQLQRQQEELNERWNLERAG